MGMSHIFMPPALKLPLRKTQPSIWSLSKVTQPLYSICLAAEGEGCGGFGEGGTCYLRESKTEFWRKATVTCIALHGYLVQQEGDERGECARMIA